MSDPEPTRPPEQRLVRRVVVTGSSGGIGRAIAVRAAIVGAEVIVHGCGNRVAAEHTLELVKQAGQTASIVMADIANPADRSRLVNQAFGDGPVDAWVHCAGVDVLTGRLAKASFEEKLDRLWEVDVRGTMLLSRLVAERMAERPEPEASSMIFIGWDQAPRGMEGEAGQLFGPIKSAVMSYSNNLAQALAPRIRVNCVAPGWIRTEWGESTDDYWDRRARRSSLAGRWGTPADVAAAVAYLISPEAEFIIGQTIEVNGGWNRRFER